MNQQHLITQTTALKLQGFQQALQEQFESPNHNNLTFEERLAMLLDREIHYKENKRVTNLLKRSKLRYSASPEDIDFKAKRNLDRQQFLSLANCEFVNHKHNVIITGPTGCGKTYLACALGNKACRMGYKVKYLHLPKFLESLNLSHADGSFAKLEADLQKADVLILDDFGLTSMNAQQRHDLFGFIEDRYQLRSTIMTSQLPMSKWHAYLKEPTIADAIMDRLLEHLHRLELEGESMRRKKG